VSIEDTPADDLPPRVDLIAALVWMVFGAAIAVGSWRMDRLAHLHINRYEIPGLVPGLLGAAIVLLGGVLAVRSLRRMASHTGAGAPVEPLGPLAGVFVATLGYALVLVGHGVPFWLATFFFVAGFIAWFDRERQAALGRSLAHQLTLAAVYGACTSAVVTLVFEHVFLVRLP
jgi:hypothetical protein